MTRKLLMALAALAATATAAQAISRHNSTGLSCARVQSIIDSEGASIMRYPSSRNRSLTLYDRYVANGRFCSVGEFAAITYIPAADTRRCPVYHCVRPDFDDRFPFFN